MVILRFSLRLHRNHIFKKRVFSRYLSTTSGYSSTGSKGVTLQDISAAKSYCSNLLQKFDSPSYTLLPFIPSSAQTAYIAIRAFNLEIARVADSVSTPHVGAIRFQFWRDNIARTFEGTPPKHPVATLLFQALEELAVGTNGKGRLNQSWFMKVIAAREQYLNNAPYPNMESLEKYAENTYSTLLYLTLQSLPMNSITADHLASHIGKAAGIVAVLRGLPLLAFPPPPKHHSNTGGMGGMVQQQAGRSQQGVVTLPLDVMAETGLREEDVLRKGAEAEGLRDAVFKVATRASDHLITARSMMQNIRRGEEVGHSYEHEDDEDHKYDLASSSSTTQTQIVEIDQAFGVFMPAVSTALWLERLQRLDFDIFREELRRREWKLPWKAYLAYKRSIF